jgi:hypothetical protein
MIPEMSQEPRTARDLVHRERCGLRLKAVSLGLKPCIDEVLERSYLNVERDTRSFRQNPAIPGGSRNARKFPADAEMAETILAIVNRRWSAQRRTERLV